MVKKILKQCFNAFGYNITKIIKKVDNKQNITNFKNNSGPKLNYKVTDPLLHNTSLNMDMFFSDKTNLDFYVNGRQKFYNSLADKILGQVSKFYKEIKVVDVGCGPGDLINILSKRVNKNQGDNIFYGFDHSKRVIEIGHARFPHINFLEFNIFEDQLKYPGYFDLIICSEVIEHLLEHKKAVNSLISMLKEGGTLIITVPEGRKDTYLGHINFWSPESWKFFIKEVCEVSQLKFEADLLEVENKQYNYATIKKEAVK